MPKQTPMSSYEQLAAEVSNDSSFYQVPKEMALKAIHARLTAADWALWTYVQVFDPHGDRMKQLPEIAKIAQTIGVSERQIQRSLAKLKQLELYDWEPVVIRGQNLAGKKAKELTKQKREAKSSDESKTTKLSQPGQSCRNQDKVVTTRTKLSQPGQSCQDRAPKPPSDNDSGSPQT
ncbi:hypothetical protein IQ272_29730, partial [Chroococcidiopsidales cyanobacterium LEGE 13417]|nr:hypothetical protein [Chroococcidiopsidales cyanobacterium LEGE 13417]